MADKPVSVNRKWKYFLRVKNGKKFTEQIFTNFTELHEARRKAILDEVFLSTGAFLD
jgi:hypothetical protein